MQRHSPGEGSIYQRGDGKWCGALQLDGKRRVVYGKTRKEAADKLQNLTQTTRTAGRLPDASKLTVSEYVTEWLTQSETRLRPKTLADYSIMTRLHICPNVGTVRLSRLQPLQVARLYSTLSKTLSKRRVAMVHAFLHKLLADAHRWGLLPNNPAALVDAPKRENKLPSLWTREQVTTFLVAMLEDDNAYGALFAFLLATGCRIGEALGLRWSDVDWEQATIRIERQITELHSRPLELSPKTRAGVRTIAVPEWGLALLHRQKAKTAQWRLRLGKDWPSNDRVFATTTGTVPLQGNVRRALHEACARLGLPLIRTHDLRHISLSLLAMSGVPVKVAQQRAGHSTAAVTLNIYQHVLGDADKQAAKALEDVVIKGGGAMRS